jgi:hypothetical protein
MRILVCGGRDFTDARLLNRTLDEQHARTPITLLIHGNARGADLLADEWAFSRLVETKRFQADWIRHKNSAGPIRNKQMLVEGKPDLVIAFRGGAGTSDMMTQARHAGVEVREIR